MVVTFQLGKGEADKNFIETIKASFKRHNVIKIKVLKTQTRDKEELEKIASLMVKELETDNRRFKYKILGFTIIINKFRKTKHKDGKNNL